MPGRKKLPDHLLKNPRRGPKIRNPYNIKPLEQRGLKKAGSEPNVVKSFWKEHSMDQIEQMTDEEIIQAIDKYLDVFIDRQKKQNPTWDFPINPKMLAIDPNWKK